MLSGLVSHTFTNVMEPFRLMMMGEPGVFSFFVRASEFVGVSSVGITPSMLIVSCRALWCGADTFFIFVAKHVSS